MGIDDILANPADHDLSIHTLGRASVANVLTGQRFVQDHERIALTSDAARIHGICAAGAQVPSLEKAGPRQQIYHDPAWTRAAIVTCGGLAPGLNAVIKGLVQVLWFDYGVRHVFGIPYGYRGLNPKYRLAPIQLTPELVDTIHEEGGTMLGSSRGEQDPKVMVDTLQRLNINILFCVGGDGTLRGAHAIAEEVAFRKLPISVVGIPKTIDNDLNLVDHTFGFETAVYKAAEIITNAHMEARGAHNGLAIVKLMGRDSGFIAAYATLANTVVNMCLVPEVPFQLEGPTGLFEALRRRFERGKTHAVLVVAEGAGQHLFEGLPEARDASGNILKHDIGDFLVDKIRHHFDQLGMDIPIRYFDPSYSIRSVPARGTDAIFCTQLAENAAHAAMSGRTDMVVGSTGGVFTHVPIPYATSERKKLDIDGPLWHAVLSSTRQMDYFRASGRA
ncbi:MAG TPA: ATP-dependent 6-phosphofructokinase [Fibrobacteria bacterium]|nr:ATP-dependent 6-phosphofructokinase [Fibrobacteria bacterium]